MAEKRLPEHSARRLVDIGKREFDWTVGQVLQHQSLTAFFYDDGSDGADLESGIEYGVSNGWFVINPATREFPSANFTLTELGDLA